MSNVIKNIYFYLFAAIGLVFILIGLVQLIQLGLRAWVFQEADVYVSYPAPKPVEIGTTTTVGPTQEELDAYQRQDAARNRQRQATTGISFLLVGIQLFAFHFRIIKRNLNT